MYQLKYILLFPLLLISYWCAAQVYPVHGTVILTPPYSVYLPDYAAEGQLRLLLQQRDLSQASYLLTIRMDLKLNGRSIMRTSPNYRPAPFSIAPGNPVALTGTDLLPYLDARNIDFSGYSRSEYERTKSLPEGSYTLCFTAYDYRRPEVAVSSATCGFYYLAKAEPPLINLPQCGTLIPSQGAMSVLFQWMPRNTSSLNSAMNTTYRFELFEVRPEGANPKAVVANSRPIFTEDIDQTQFFYNSTHPYLTHGMQYAWRVQAIDRSGRDAFRNKGYSEVCYFTFGGSPHTIDPLQKAPQGLQAKALTPQRGGAFWNKGNFDSYRFYFRKVGPNYEWFPREVRDTSLVFGELVPQIEYECRVQGKRGEFYGPYSDIVRFFTPEQPAPVACLDTTDYSKRPKGDPLETLIVGDKVDSYGFSLNIKTLQSLGSGWYKGTGLMTIPFLNNIGVKVFFDRMYVNTLYQNTDGEIKAVSRPRTQWVKDKLGSQGIVTKGTIKTDTQPDFTINLQGAPPIIRDGQGQVINAQNPPKTNEKGIAEGPFTISVLDDKGSVKEVKVDQLPATLRDASGAVYQVNTDGKVTKVGQELAPEEQFTEEQLTNAISFGDGRVQFRQADGYALDTMKNMYNEKKVFHQVFTELGYEYITRWGGATRTVFDEFKAMEAGKPARVIAVFKLTNLTTGRRRPDMLRFVTGHNVRLFPIDSVVHHISEKTALISYTLEIPAGEEKDGLNIYAMLRTHPDKAHCIGKLTALSYRPQHLEVVMVYVGKTANKINLTDIQAKLDKIYNPIGVYIKVKDDRNFNPDPKWDINSDNKLNVLGSGAFSTLTPEMRALNAAYRATPQYNRNQAVLFVLEKSDSANIAGDMPRGEQFGYIFADALKNVDVGWLVAHELGHGLFTLQHSWKNNGESSEGKTDNLMDYNKGTSLSKYQWDLIHNPENVWDWLKRDQESMVQNPNSILTSTTLKSSIQKGVFLTPAGFPIWLENVDEVTVFDKSISGSSPNQIPFHLGTLLGFRLQNGDSYYWGKNQSYFKGYVKQGTEKLVIYPNQKTPQYIGVKDDKGQLVTQINLWNIDKNDFENYEDKRAFPFLDFPEDWAQYGSGPASTTIFPSSIKYWGDVKSQEELIAKSATLRHANWNNDVERFANIIKKLQTTGTYISAGVHAEDNARVVELLNDKLLTYHTITGKTVYVVANRIDYGIPSDSLHIFTKDVFQKAGLNNDVLLLTLPYALRTVVSSDTKNQNIGSADYLFPSPGVFGQSAPISLPSYKTFKEFVSDFYITVPKPLHVYTYIVRFDGHIEYIKSVSSGNLTGYNFINQIRYFIDSGVKTTSDLFSSRKDCRKPTTSQYQINALEEKWRTLASLQASERAMSDYKQQDINLMESSIPQYHAAWVLNNFVSQYPSFKNELSVSIPSKVDDNKLLVSEKGDWILNTIDALSIATSFFGVDIVFDFTGAVYCYAKGDYLLGGIYSGAVVIPAVSGTAASNLSKAMVGLAGKTASKKTLAQLFFLLPNVAKADVDQLLIQLEKEGASSIQLLARLDLMGDQAAILVKEMASNDRLTHLLLRNPDAIQAWQILRNSYLDPSSADNLLFRNIEAIEALAKIRTNPRLVALGLTDDALGKIRGYGTGTSVASYTEVITDLDNLCNFIHAHPGTKLQGYETSVAAFSGNNNNAKQGAHWIFRNIASDAETFGGKTFRLGQSVRNARGNTSYIDVFCEHCVPRDLKIEYKSGPGSISSSSIKDQFIERDLFVAKSLDEIQWRMTNTGMTKEKLVGWLEENKEVLKNIPADKANTLLKRNDLTDGTDLQKGKLADAFIDYFKNDINYSKIFK